MRLRSTLLAAVFLGLAAPAMAQHPCPGYVTANAMGAVPRNTPITISGNADNESERRLREAVVVALQRAGHRVTEDAPFLLSWRGGVSQDGLGRPNSRGVADMFSGSIFHDSDDLHWMQDVPRMSQRPKRGPARLSGFVELRDRESRRVVWTAVVSCERQGFDQAALFGVLTSAVVPLIGRSANAQRF